VQHVQLLYFNEVYITYIYIYINSGGSNLDNEWFW